MDTTLTDPLVGRLLDGRYLVQERLARGGMASVYTALDTRLDRRVAVKVMHPGLADDDEFVARFIREARSAAGLSHPNVVSVFDQGADAGFVFLVMELVQGHTLRDLLRERHRLTPAEALAVMEPVLAALAAAHRAGLVHRDVKPENVLLARDGTVKVADFGLVRAAAAAAATTTGSVLLGTVAYLAPEQVERGIADARADVYAAGVMLYELVVGRPPFEGDTPLAVAYRHVHEDVPPPSSAAPGIPAGIDQLVLAATAREPADRPADAGALLQTLRRVRADVPRARVPLPADTEPVPRLQRDTLVVGREPEPPADEERRRRRRWPYVVGLVVLATLAAAVAGWWLAAGRYIPTPSFIYDSQAQARTLAHDHGLHVRFTNTVFSDTIPAGEIATQSPAAGHRIADGGTVTLHLSAGPHMVRVPVVATLDPVAATQKLRQAGLTVAGQVPQYSPTVKPGLVVGTDPRAGTSVRFHARVKLLVSEGPPPVPVPSVVDDPLQQATTILTQAHFTATTTLAFSDTVPKDDVISQTPPPGGLLAPGGTVQLVVSRGPQLFTVPDVVGMTYQHAETVLRRAGFVPNVQALPVGPGIVRSEDPAGGSKRRHGTTVTLFVF